MSRKWSKRLQWLVSDGEGIVAAFHDKDDANSYRQLIGADRVLSKKQWAEEKARAKDPFWSKIVYP